jgi:hypothetical protein
LPARIRIEPADGCSHICRKIHFVI